jgi:hypothetical protein
MSSLKLELDEESKIVDSGKLWFVLFSGLELISLLILNSCEVPIYNYFHPFLFLILE